MDIIKGILAVLVFIIFIVIASPFLFITVVFYLIGYPTSLVMKGLIKIRDKIMNYLLT